MNVYEYDSVLGIEARTGKFVTAIIVGCDFLTCGADLGIVQHDVVLGENIRISIAGQSDQAVTESELILQATAIFAQENLAARTDGGVSKLVFVWPFTLAACSLPARSREPGSPFDIASPVQAKLAY